jgi:hypothetical protein
MSAIVNLTNPGWYLINFVAVRGRASLRKYDPASSPPYLALTQWDNSPSPNYYESYPQVVNLAAGYHYFYWIPDGNTFFYVTEGERHEAVRIAGSRVAVTHDPADSLSQRGFHIRTRPADALDRPFLILA